MDWQRLRISAETTAIRVRSRVRLAIALVGIGLVLLGGYNLFGAPLTDGVTLTFYRDVLVAVGLEEYAITYLAEVVVIAVGAVLAWFS
jgi:hypothetical protein